MDSVLHGSDDAMLEKFKNGYSKEVQLTPTATEVVANAVSKKLENKDAGIKAKVCIMTCIQALFRPLKPGDDRKQYCLTAKQGLGPLLLLPRPPPSPP
eukprot:1877550-Pyramimonas_sp.AAC.1